MIHTSTPKNTVGSKDTVESMELLLMNWAPGRYYTRQVNWGKNTHFMKKICYKFPSPGFKSEFFFYLASLSMKVTLKKRFSTPSHHADKNFSPHQTTVVKSNLSFWGSWELPNVFQIHVFIFILASNASTWKFLSIFFRLHHISNYICNYKPNKPISAVAADCLQLKCSFWWLNSARETLFAIEMEIKSCMEKASKLWVSPDAG